MEGSTYHEEKLILMVVMVPDKLPLELDELYLLSIELAADFRTPVFVKESELFEKVDFHGG